MSDSLTSLEVPLPITWITSSLALCITSGFRRSSAIAHSVVDPEVSLPAINKSCFENKTKHIELICFVL